MSRGKASKARISRSERATQALALRKQGLTFRRIGQLMGVTEQRAHRIVTEELGRLNATRSEAADQVLRLELERLDELHKALWPRARTGDVEAVDAVLRVMGRRAKLLGLDVNRLEVEGRGLAVVLAAVERAADRGSLTPEQVRSTIKALQSRLPTEPAPMADEEKLLALQHLLARFGYGITPLQDGDGQAGPDLVLPGAGEVPLSPSVIEDDDVQPLFPEGANGNGEVPRLRGG